MFENAGMTQVAHEQLRLTKELQKEQRQRAEQRSLDDFACTALQVLMPMMMLKGGMSMEVDMAHGGLPVGMKADTTHINYAEVAFEAYELAEAMVAERKKRMEKQQEQVR